MGRAMVFIDFENFNIAMMNYYRKIEEPTARLDYNKFPQKIVSLLPGNHTLEKTFCVPQSQMNFLCRMSAGKIHITG